MINVVLKQIFKKIYKYILKNTILTAKESRIEAGKSNKNVFLNRTTFWQLYKRFLTKPTPVEFLLGSSIKMIYFIYRIA